MLVTEQEAKTKRCIQVFAAVNTLPMLSDRNAATVSGATQCVGSACMAWRWSIDSIDPHDLRRVPYTGERERKGYCGLAGAL